MGEVHEEVDVRVGCVVSSGHAAEDLHASTMMGSDGGENISSPSLQSPRAGRDAVEPQQSRHLGLASADGLGDLPLREARGMTSSHRSNNQSPRPFMQCVGLLGSCGHDRNDITTSAHIANAINMSVSGVEAR